MDFGPDALQLFSRGLRLKAPLGFWQENLRASLKKKSTCLLLLEDKERDQQRGALPDVCLATNELFLSVVYNMVIRP